MVTSPNPLDALRARIDDIDDRIHDLLMQRTEVVEEVARVKHGTGGSVLRPGREAAILRRLVGRHRGPFPRAALVRMWRELLAAQVGVQADLAIAVYVPDDQAGYWDLARDHFGSHTAMTAYGSIGQVVRAVAEHAGTFGVLPMPEEGDRDPWWRLLVTPDGNAPRVVARLPFAGRGNARASGDALAIGRAALEPTGLDRSLFVLETRGDISRARLFAALEQCGLACSFFARHERQPDSAFNLVELAAYVSPQDERLQRFAARIGRSIERIVPLGGYAVPMSAAELAGAAPA